MAALVLGIVLIIGYHFESKNPIGRLKFVRKTGYHIYFSAGRSGLILFVFALIPWLIIDFYDLPSTVFNFSQVDPSTTFLKNHEQWIVIKSISVAIVMYVLSVISSFGLTQYYKFNKRKLVDKLFDIANDLEKLIIESTFNASPIRIELECGKIYVGFPQSPDLEQGEITHLTLLPLLSGQRDKDQKIVLTNNYEKHYGVLLQEPSDNTSSFNLLSEFRVVIPATTIIIASKFDLESFIAIENSFVYADSAK